ncbi:MAG: nucleotidyltransferase domain-containing protein [Nanoarchaeota archaeon]|nr:nucleotidyltransferase domain-containing protein [Nanoarchaeota archaeon]
MKQEYFRVARRVGTSAGVILPVKLLGATVKINIVEEPVNPLIDSLKIVEKNELAGEVLGIVLAGSYARGDYEVGSDVDILVISSKKNLMINEGRYSILVMSLDVLKKRLVSDVIVYSMIVEGECILNKSLLDELKGICNKKSVLKNYVIATLGVLKKLEKMIDLDEKLGNKLMGDSVGYSLVLRIRGLLYLNEKYNKKKLKKIVGDNIYERYLLVKSGKMGNGVEIEKAKELINYLRGALNG